jgi:tetraacyldisaccharide 4'-kinase
MAGGGPVGAGLVRLALWLASLSYGVILRCRRWAYWRGLLRSHAADVPVISIGNITTGGTGKTPMVLWAVEKLVSLGHHPAVLTRGYASVAGRSDEAELLRQELAGRKLAVPVIVNPNRRTGAAQALAAGADVLVMDDGFQHMALRRNLDIVLIDATLPFGYGYVLPRGLLREPLAALRAADAIVITRCDQVGLPELATIEQELRAIAPQASLHRACHAPLALRDEAGQIQPPTALAGQNVVAFCGLGNPWAFFTTLRGLGANIVARMPLDDHARYTPDVIKHLGRLGTNAGAAAMVTSAKDAVKLPRPSQLPLPLWTLLVEVRITDNAGSLEQAVAQAAAVHTGGRSCSC